jgi:hypothetical protein
MTSMKQVKRTAIESYFHFYIFFVLIIRKKQGLCNPARKVFTCTPLALLPEARNRAGVLPPSAPLALGRSKKPK